MKNIKIENANLKDAMGFSLNPSDKNRQEAILLINSACKIIYKSPSIKILFGLKSEPLNLNDVTQSIHHADKIKFQQKLKLLDEKEAQIAIPAFRIVVENKILGWVHGSGFNLIDKQCVDAIVLCFHVISESDTYEKALIESENKYKNIIENLTDIYYRTDTSGNLLMASPSCLGVFGYASMEDVLGKNIEELYLKKGERIEFLEMLKKEGKVKNYRTNLQKKDGTLVYVETTANLVFDKDGNVVGVDGILRDISDRMRAEQALRLSESDLRETNATKDRLFSIIAHDLKSPFTSILGFSELLNDNLNDLKYDEIHGYIAHIHNSAKSTLSLLDNLLLWAKTQTGQIVYNPRPLNCGFMLQEVLNVLYPLASMKNITVILPKDCELFIKADPNMFLTILRNLICNAIKFTQSGGVVEIYYKTENNIVEIIVSDNGVGIDGQVLQKLFQIDKTVSTKGTAKESGSGLGLIICKEFVEKHGGKIWAESIPGQGSKFHFTIMRADN